MLQALWNVTRRMARWFFRFGILVNIVTLAGALWFVEGVLLRSMDRPSRGGGTGSTKRPIGADPIARWYGRQSTWLTIRIRRWLGDYVESRHPRAFQHLRRMFR